MQDLENNMDELLRKAADNYQLKAGESKWDDIVPQLISESLVPAAKKKNNLKKYTLLFLLLFLVTGGIFTKYFVSKNTLASLSKPSEKDNMINPVEETNIMNKEVSEAYKKHKQKIETRSGINYPLQQKKGELIKNKFAAKTNSANAIQKKLQRMEPMNSYQVIKVDRSKMMSEEPESSFKMRIEKSATLQPDLTNKLTALTISDKMIQENRAIVQKKNMADTQTAIVREPGQQQDKHGIYVGVVLGPSLNEVKSQGLKKAGFDIGIIAGYKVSSRISIETGLLFAKKYYFSDGKYFNPGKTNASMPASMKVLSLEGSSAVIEVPVKLKYDLLQKNKVSLFTSAGVSSYILTNEKNKYRALLNGTEQSITSSYKKGSRYFAAAVDLSVGYERKIGKFTSIRIEPYLQIPLKGIGVGAMPVMSSGLHFGINRHIQ
jgi:hypothetical protein